jgi:hypothetical protein
MPGLLKTIGLFALIAAALWYADAEDPRDRYPAIDPLFWTCLATAAVLCVRAAAELMRSARKGGDERETTVSGRRPD